MVNNQPINVSRHGGTPPTNGVSKESRYIGSARLYTDADVRALIEQLSFRLVTKDAIANAADLGFEQEDIRDLLTEMLRIGRYLKSEWCQISGKNAWAACDAYVVTKKCWCENANREISNDIYIKFAIANTGLILIIVSCHLSS